MKTNDSFSCRNRNFTPRTAFSGEEPSFFTASSVFPGYGARYLESRTGRWLSADPAMGEYIPSPGKDTTKLPGLGGIYNTVNLHVYHYAGNNPVKYTDPDGRAIVIPAIVIAIAKAGAIGAAVSGIIDVAKQALATRNAPDGMSIDMKQTGAAMAGGFVAGAISGGVGVGAGLLEPIAAKGAVIAGGAIAGGAGSATTTAVDNASHGRPISENMAENVIVGAVVGTISGAATKAPAVPYNAPSSYKPITGQAVIREAGKELWNGVRDEILSRGIERIAEY